MRFRFLYTLLFFILWLLGCTNGVMSSSSFSNGNPPDANTFLSRKRVFITSTTYNGAFGTLAMADGYCASQAAAGSLGGAWKAWLSDTVTDVSARVTDVSPWYLIDRMTVIFNQYPGAANFPAVGITMTESGVNIGNVSVWTGTDNNNVKTASLCISGTAWNTSSGVPLGTGGFSNFTTFGWTDNQSFTCSSLLHLYCFEQ
jgi:hypothetical protein